MNYVHIIAVLAILQFFYFGIMVGRARGKYGVHAPATSGHEGFDREFRVQMNTLEQIVGFLPALLLASLYWPNAVIAGIGVVYLIGRFLYRRSYVANPASRGLGFALTVIPTFVLLLAALVGVGMRYTSAG
ncbi:MAG: MAPEG family protein [Dokdonella sp.]